MEISRISIMELQMHGKHQKQVQFLYSAPEMSIIMDKKIDHVAIIMDGNGRWAEKRNLSRSMGHQKGSKTLEKIALYAKKIGIKYLSVFAFSTDNFKRSKEEVNFLMDLFIKMFNNSFNTIVKHDIKVIFSGSKSGLRDDVVDAMNKIVDKSQNNQSAVLNICLNYGGQEEIIRASLKMHDELNTGKIQKEDIDRKTFYNYLDHCLPPIDLLIRTGGEMRISNFMLYELSYAEFYFTNTFFPDFNENEFDKAIDIYLNRDRRFGGINESKTQNNN